MVWARHGEKTGFLLWLLLLSPFLIILLDLGAYGLLVKLERMPGGCRHCQAAKHGGGIQATWARRLGSWCRHPNCDMICQQLYASMCVLAYVYLRGQAVLLECVFCLGPADVCVCCGSVWCFLSVVGSDGVL